MTCKGGALHWMPGVPVCAYAAVAEHNGRLHQSVEGRLVTIINHKGTLYCIDRLCYHAGLPLTDGVVVEDIEDTPCLDCPWHHYKVSLATGEGFYRGLEFVDGKPVPTGWKSKGRKQRTHEVEVRDDGIVYVHIDDGSDGAAVDSDRFATRPDKQNV